MVIHLMISEGDPVPANPSVKGKTTKKGKNKNNEGTKSANTKKLPSYRQKDKKQDIAWEGSIFNARLPYEQQQESRIEKPPGSLEIQKPNEMGNDLETATDANLDAGEGSNNFNLQEETRNEGGSSRASQESEEDRDGEESEEEELTSEEMAGNVQALKADVDGVHLHLRNTAETSMRDMAADLDAELEGHKSEISTLLRPITQKYFPDDATLKLEELVFDRLSDSILIAMRDSVEIFLADTAGDLDEVVADKEEEGMDLMEISGFLEDWEKDTVPDVQEEVQKVANSLKETFGFVIPEKARETVEKVFEKLEHTVNLELNLFGQYTVEPEINVDISEEEAAEAIVKVIAEDADEQGGAVVLVASDDDQNGNIGGGEEQEEEHSEDGNEEGEEEGIADEQAEDGGDEEEQEGEDEVEATAAQVIETGQIMGGNTSNVEVAAAAQEERNELPQVEEQVEAAGNATADEWPTMNQPVNGQGFVDAGLEGIGTGETGEENIGGAIELGGTQQAAGGGFGLGEETVGGANQFGGTQLAANGEVGVGEGTMVGGENGLGSTQQAAEGIVADPENAAGGFGTAQGVGAVQDNMKGGFGATANEVGNMQPNVEGGEGIVLGQSAIGNMGQQNMEGAEETEQADIGGVGEESVQAGEMGGGQETEGVNIDIAGLGSAEQAGAEQTTVLGGGEVTGGENTGGVEGTEQVAVSVEVAGDENAEGAGGTEEAAAGGAGDKKESNSGDDDDEEAD